MSDVQSFPALSCTPSPPCYTHPLRVPSCLSCPSRVLAMFGVVIKRDGPLFLAFGIMLSLSSLFETLPVFSSRRTGYRFFVTVASMFSWGITGFLNMHAFYLSEFFRVCYFSRKRIRWRYAHQAKRWWLVVQLEGEEMKDNVFLTFCFLSSFSSCSFVQLPFIELCSVCM